MRKLLLIVAIIVCVTSAACSKSDGREEPSVPKDVFQASDANMSVPSKKGNPTPPTTHVESAQQSAKPTVETSEFDKSKCVIYEKQNGEDFCVTKEDIDNSTGLEVQTYINNLPQDEADKYIVTRIARELSKIAAGYDKPLKTLDISEVLRKSDEGANANWRFPVSGWKDLIYDQPDGTIIWEIHNIMDDKIGNGVVRNIGFHIDPKVGTFAYIRLDESQ